MQHYQRKKKPPRRLELGLDPVGFSRIPTGINDKSEEKIEKEVSFLF